jgi:hypothetical protein
MSAFLNYEGTSDFIATTPYLAITLAASGSITAGRGVCVETLNPGYCYQPPAGTISGSLKPAGVALATTADGSGVPVLVWGYAKSLPTLPTDRVFSYGDNLVITGSGYWTASGSCVAAAIAPMSVAGRIVSGSAGYIFAFVDCFGP